MKTVRLGDLLTEIKPGFASGSRSAGGILQVRMHNVGTDGTLSWNSECRVPRTELPSERHILQDQDVLFNATNSQELVGKTALFREIGEEVTFSNHFYRLRVDRSNLAPAFLSHWLKSLFLSGEFNRGCVRWVNQATFRADRLVELQIPLPPLPEQKRIAAILDKADAIRRKREQSLQLAQQFLRSLFLEMFGDPVQNPKSWPKSTFGDQLSLIQYGPRFHNEPYTETGIRTVRITDLDVLGYLSFESMPRIQADQKAINAYALRPGDLIFARSGATVGKTALIEPQDPQCIAGAYFLRMRFNSAITPLYARQVLVTDSIQHVVESQSRQSAQQNFSGPAIKRLPLPIPPLGLQLKFAAIEKNVRMMMKQLGGQEADARNLSATLAHRSFNGEL